MLAAERWALGWPTAFCKAQPPIFSLRICCPASGVSYSFAASRSISRTSVWRSGVPLATGCVTTNVTHRQLQASAGLGLKDFGRVACRGLNDLHDEFLLP